MIGKVYLYIAVTLLHAGVLCCVFNSNVIVARKSVRVCMFTYYHIPIKVFNAILVFTLLRYIYWYDSPGKVRVSTSPFRECTMLW